MKHHCHCGFKKHHQLTKGKRLGALGATLMILHLLYHIAECLILPAVFMAFSNHSSDAAVAASEDAPIIEQSELELEETPQASTLFSSKVNLYTDFFETLY